MLSYLGDKIVGLTLAVLNVLAPFEVHVTKGVAYADGIEHRADIYRSAARGASGRCLPLWRGMAERVQG